MAKTATKPDAPNALTVWRNDLAKMEGQFKAALPSHISPARFIRSALTLFHMYPDLLRCEHDSVLRALMQSAADGLLPDGRLGVIVPFKEDGKLKAVWLPMIAGLRDKARRSGLLTDWEAHVVHEGDDFEYELGDNPRIRHVPAKRGGRTRPVIAAYSIATYPDGHKSREVMNIDAIEDVRKRYVRSSRGPWSDPVAYPEMCRKTVARLHAKQLPQSSDLDRLIHRDDILYSLDQARQENARLPASRPRSIAAAFDIFAGESGPLIEGEASPEPGAAVSPEPGHTGEPQGDASTGATGDASAGADAADDRPTDGVDGPPTNPEGYRRFAQRVIDMAKTPEERATLGPWWASPQQRSLRNACGVDRGLFDELAAAVQHASPAP